MADVKQSESQPPSRPTSSTTASTTATAPPPSAAARQRLSQGRSARQDMSPAPKPDPSPKSRRRFSSLSFSSIDDVAQSLNDDIIAPRTGNTRRAPDEDEVTHWHSSPLAFAILPAVAGLMFKNGSAFMTDLLLLALAAIFLNWSIRLPWDWYYSAQFLRRDQRPEDSALVDDLEDETAVDTASSTGSSPKPPLDRRRDTVIETDQPVQNIARREEAMADLRQQEFMALGATFAFPALAAYLLHVIRAQLSRPSTGLVSDYNLCVFLLAAEIRPVRQVIKLMAKRTLYLQRTVTGLDDPFVSSLGEKSTIDGLTARILELESKLTDQVAGPPTVAQKADVSDLSTEFRKRYEPRFEGLERAVRRYEKRSTTMAINVEQRLQSLEIRLQEALSLAAVAAKHSDGRSIVSRSFDALVTVLAFPAKLVIEMFAWPIRVLDELYIRTKILLLGPMPPKMSRSKYGSGREDKPRDKPSRKVLR